MNRRDVLKLFGVGATVVPIIGGSPNLGAESKLIATPEVEPVIQPQFGSGFVPELLEARAGKIQVSIRVGDKSYWFAADTFFTESSVRTVDVTSLDLGYFRKYVPRESEMEWTLKGKLMGSASA